MPFRNILSIADCGKILKERRERDGNRGGSLTEVLAQGASQDFWHEMTGIPSSDSAYSVTNRPTCSGMTLEQGRGHDHGTGI